MHAGGCTVNLEPAIQVFRLHPCHIGSTQRGGTITLGSGWHQDARQRDGGQSEAEKKRFFEHGDWEGVNKPSLLNVSPGKIVSAASKAGEADKSGASLSAAGPQVNVADVPRKRPQKLMKRD
jgi:hypothetical protein